MSGRYEKLAVFWSIVTATLSRSAVKLALLPERLQMGLWMK